MTMQHEMNCPETTPNSDSFCTCGLVYREAIADHNRLVREIDVIINGEAGAAKQASLCDLVGQIRRLAACRETLTTICIVKDDEFTECTLCRRMWAHEEGNQHALTCPLR